MRVGLDMESRFKYFRIVQFRFNWEDLLQHMKLEDKFPGLFS